jgi:putative holliday junction resolvase
MRILGIDYGTKRIGLAVSDESQTLARELSIFSPQEFWQNIHGLIGSESIERIVIGLPLNMSGEQTGKTREVEEFSERLQQKVSVPTEFMDERLSSVMAENLPGGRKDVDSLAAQIILPTYV